VVNSTCHNSYLIIAYVATLTIKGVVVMALASAETFSYGQEIDPRQLNLGQTAIAVEVYFRPEMPSTGASMGQRELRGVIKGVPSQDSEAGFVLLQPFTEDGHSSPSIHVLNIARATAMFDRQFVESCVYFYPLESVTQ
jgi:hypothetical protein